jgi:hypothetical protein
MSSVSNEPVLHRFLHPESSEFDEFGILQVDPYCTISVRDSSVIKNKCIATMGFLVFF